jgi:hypothetical protein
VSTGVASPPSPGDVEAGATGPVAALTTDRARAVGAVLVTLAALTPVFVVVFQRWGSHVFFVQDHSVIDLRVRDVFTFSGNTPLTGPYSRFGWNHPGPIMYYLLAVFAAPFGYSAWATLVGAALLQGVAIAWTARLAWKVGGLRWLIAWTTVVVLAYGATGAWILEQAEWNPHLVYPFFVLFLLQCWCVSVGQTKRLLGLAFVATFLLQTHIGYAPLVVVLLAWALVRLVLASRRRAIVLTSPVVWKWPAILLAVLWFPPLVLDPILHPPGNIAHVASWYSRRGGGASTLGLKDGAGYLAREFAWIPPWLGGSDPLSPLSALPAPVSPAWLLVPAGLVAAAWGSARSRARAELQALAEMLGVLLVVSVVTLAFLRGTPSAYLYYWRIIVGAAVIVLSLFVLVEALDSTRRQVFAIGFRVVAVLAIVVSTIGFARDVSDADGTIQAGAASAQAIMNQVDRQPVPATPFVVRYEGTTLLGIQGGVVDQLDRQGAPVRVDESLGYQFGYDRAVPESAVHTVWLALEESVLTSLYSQYPDAHVVAMTHPLPPAQLAELLSLQRHLARVLDDEGHAALIPSLSTPFVAYQLQGVPGVPKDQVNRLAVLNAKVQQNECLCSVIAFPSGSVPPPYVPAPLPG